MKPSITSSNFFKKHKTLILRIAAIAFWIAVWEAVALRIGSELIIATPIKVAQVFIEMIFKADTWHSLGFSLVRISSGFALAFILGSVLAAVSSRLQAVKILLSPITSAIKSTPVASFVILAIIWFGSKNLSVFISFLMVFPVIYLNILKGIESVDKELLEMAKVFNISLGRRIVYIYMPSLMPFVISACSVALGLCWKSGVAAEVIGISSGSIGERLYRAKLYFETGELLAWTAAIILISTAFEKLIMLILRRVNGIPQRAYSEKLLNASAKRQTSQSITAAEGISLENVSKSFGERTVLNGVTLIIAAGEHTAVMGMSGAGKTTLARIAAGLERQESGRVERPSRLGFVFQEDRLIGCLNALGNLAIAGADPQEAYETLKAFRFTDELIFKPSETLSGGEKRRAAIARALLCGAGTVILDEPFKGIDDETLHEYILPQVKRLTDGKTVLMITHSESETAELCSRTVDISKSI